MTNLSDRKMKREGVNISGRNSSEWNRGSFDGFILGWVLVLEMKSWGGDGMTNLSEREMKREGGKTSSRTSKALSKTGSMEVCNGNCHKRDCRNMYMVG